MTGPAFPGSEAGPVITNGCGAGIGTGAGGVDGVRVGAGGEKAGREVGTGEGAVSVF